ncbi:MAG: tetratricopeptide repeat protein [Thermoanaerobaculia bacterium]
MTGRIPALLGFCALLATLRAGAVETAALRGAPLGPRELPTTSARIYLGNVERQIRALEAGVRREPANLDARRELAALQHMHGVFREDLDEIQSGIEQIGECIRRSSGSGPFWLLRASQELSLHRFREAQADLERARVLGAGSNAAAAVEQELDWNQGRFEKAIASIRAAARARPTVDTMARLARLEHDLGNYEAADRAFEQAEDLIVDPNPIPVAWLSLQRGRHKLDLGEYDQAVVFFSEALARVPSYPAAREALGEAFHLLGRDEEAAAQYRQILEQDPRSDVAADLALLYRAMGRPSEAAALALRARQRYEELLIRYPEAMYWHAAAFFLAQEEPGRALQLLSLNLTLRPDSPAWTAHARALFALGRMDDARRSIDRALAMPVVSADLYWTASLIYAAAGDKPQSELLARRAREHDPDIARRSQIVPRTDASGVR